jgi:hypothetical protein
MCSVAGLPPIPLLHALQLVAAIAADLLHSSIFPFSMCAPPLSPEKWYEWWFS